jgi:hypothetical protein
MFKFWKRNKSSPRSEEELNISPALDALSWALQETNRDRFVDRLDAALKCQPQLATLNTFLGRPQGSFQEVTFDEIIARVSFLRERDLFPQLLAAISSSIPMASDAVILAAAFSVEINNSRDQSRPAIQSAQEKLRGEAIVLLQRLNEFVSSPSKL